MDDATLMNANIFDLLGLQQLPEDQKNVLFEKMERIIQDRVADRVVISLTDEQRASFDQLTSQQASPESIDAFLRQAVPTFDTVMAEELFRFKKETVENVVAVRQSLIEPEQSTNGPRI